MTGPKITYAWGIRIRAGAAHQWGAVWHSYEDEDMDEEGRAREWLEREAAQWGRDNVKLVRARIETHQWEDAP